jgi:hypothetical protein
MDIGLRGNDINMKIDYPDDFGYYPEVVEEEVRFQTNNYELNV